MFTFQLLYIVLFQLQYVVVYTSCAIIYPKWTFIYELTKCVSAFVTNKLCPCTMTQFLQKWMVRLYNSPWRNECLEKPEINETDIIYLKCHENVKRLWVGLRELVCVKLHWTRTCMQFTINWCIQPGNTWVFMAIFRPVDLNANQICQCSCRAV